MTNRCPESWGPIAPTSQGDCEPSSNPTWLGSDHPAWIALLANQVDRIRAWLTQYPEFVHAYNHETETTLLMEAPSADMARCLLDAGVGVEGGTENADMWGPLHHAARHRPEVVEVLIAAGASVSKRNGDGETPLMVAVNEENAACVSLLLKSGAEVTAANHDGFSVLDLALRRSPAMIRLLVDHPSCSLEFLQTTLKYAESDGRFGVSPGNPGCELLRAVVWERQMQNDLSKAAAHDAPSRNRLRF